ncbi:MAG: carbohydrate kinase family protein [Candidatus Aenigmarchaeota archaeon]|nr:carbohydrate kinase family protein [Candidatus Aenigmarchaeota archaeon]
MKPHFQLVAVGTPSVDVLHTESGIIRRFGGGAVITVAVALAKWGMQTGIIGRLGKDSGGEWLLRNFKEDGVDVSLVKKDKIPTSIWSIDIAPGDKEILEPHIYSPLAKLSFAQKNAIKDSDAVIVRLNNPLFKETAHLAKKSGSKFFVTFHLFESSPPTIDFLRRHEPDVIFMTKEEYEEALQEFDLFSMDTLFVIMKGRDGCSIFHRGDMVSYDGYRSHIVDSTCWENSFVAGFLYGYMNGWPLNRIAKLANTLSAIATTEYGSRRKVPTRDEMEKIINFVTS